MTFEEAKLTEEIAAQLIALSEAWERENSCHGYQKNAIGDLRDRRVFIASEDGAIVGYLFGHQEIAERATSIHPAGTKYFEVEELYVAPALRSRGIGRRLFQCAESAVASEAEMMMLSTATKNFRAILHFYIDELGMEFWSARLFKKIR